MIHDRVNAMGAKPCHRCRHSVRDHQVGEGRIYCMRPLCGCDRDVGPWMMLAGWLIGCGLRKLRGGD